MSKAEKNYTKRFIIYAYIFFWGMIAILAGIYMLSGEKMWIVQWGSWICSWAPTISLWVLFKKLFPNMTIKEFYKKVFTQKINIKLILVIPVVYASLIIAAALMVSIFSNVPFKSLWNFSLPALLSGLFLTIISGPMGEESGWRGFLLPVMWEKAGVVKGALLLSVFWSFWHIPLWFMSGYVGIKLLIYIVTFIMGNMCLSLIISICYNYNRNLFVPIWIHFIANAIGVPYAGERLAAQCWDIIFYIIITIGFVIWHKRRALVEMRKTTATIKRQQTKYLY